jgi:hypothetical protein
MKTILSVLRAVCFSLALGIPVFTGWLLAASFAMDDAAMPFFFLFFLVSTMVACCVANLGVDVNLALFELSFSENK